MIDMNTYVNSHYYRKLQIGLEIALFSKLKHLDIFNIKGFGTIVFIFIVISTTFQPICPPAFFRCLLNSGIFMRKTIIRKHLMIKIIKLHLRNLDN